MEFSAVYLRLINIKKAVIDASSLIYMEKAGFLNYLENQIDLLTVPGIIEEIGRSFLQLINLKQIDADLPISMPNDQKLIACALKYDLPVISEDKKILKNLKKSRHEHYNAVMMLNYLFFKQVIHSNQYFHFLDCLLKTAHYSSYVIDFSQKLVLQMMKKH